jgi:hypothetical protein
MVCLQLGKEDMLCYPGAQPVKEQDNSHFKATVLEPLLGSGNTVGSGVFCGSTPRLYHSTNQAEVVYSVPVTVQQYIV